ncbi:MAG: M15 family metallopeptidase [Erysipelotrichaceae bacterium]
MKAKRIGFIIVLVLLFITCFSIMDKRYDPLARYPYATKENREDILKYITKPDDINYLIQQQLKPDDFMPYINLSNFDIHNVVYYDLAFSKQPKDKQFIIDFVNNYRSYFDYNSFNVLLNNYNYDNLKKSFDTLGSYNPKATLVINPSDMNLILKNNQSLGYYVPTNLVKVVDIPHLNANSATNDLYVRSEVLEPLTRLCSDAKVINDQTCGNLILTSGFISYDDQMKLYESTLLKFGADKYHLYADMPGFNEGQLGLNVTFTPVVNEEDETKVKDENKQKQIVWLEENAYRYGFTIRYPKGEGQTTGKEYQPFTLRYVGEKNAKVLYDKKITLNELVK